MAYRHITALRERIRSGKSRGVQATVRIDDRVGGIVEGHERIERQNLPYAIRELRADDTPAVAQLLAEGFPARNLDYWRKGFERLHACMVDESIGWCLESAGQIDGVVLTIRRPDRPDGMALYNASSWYVRPSARGHSIKLAMIASAVSGATYINVSPADYTRPVIKRLGFRSLNEDALLIIPLLSPRHGLRAERFDPKLHGPLLGSKAKIAADHAMLGCHVLVVRDAEKLSLFIFQNDAISFLKIGAVRAIFIEDMSVFARCAGSLARALLACGRLLVRVDGSRLSPGLVGLTVKGRAPRWCKGLYPPPPNDFCYSEMVFFGL